MGRAVRQHPDRTVQVPQISLQCEHFPGPEAITMMERLLPERVCCCLNFDLGVKILLSCLMVLRLAGLVCSVFYGPYISLVLCLSSLLLAGDIILLFSLFKQTEEAKPACDFLNQKVWIFIWE